MFHHRILILLSFPALAILLQSSLPHVTAPLDPASDLARMRAFLTTTSPAVDITLNGAEWANAVSPDQSIRVIIDGATVHVTRKTTGQVDIQLDCILAGLRPQTMLTWTIVPVSPGTSALDVYNLNSTSARHVDRFDAGTGVSQFTTAGDLLRDGGPLPAVSAVKHHLVLAFFYPWWTLDTWTSNPEVYDNPVPLYSMSDPSDLQRIMTTAKGVGVDALVMSWAGKDANGGIDDQRMRRCLAAARAAGFKMASLFETTLANPQHADGDADPDTVFTWLVDVIDRYATQPSYLRVDNKPVVFAYAAQRLTEIGWQSTLQRLRGTGRDVLLIGEGSNNTRLGAFDGQFYYPSNDQPGNGIETFDRAQALNVRTYHFLPEDTIGRRIWVGTVSPGYDDTHLLDGRVPRVTPRANGDYYKGQWRAAFDNRADWIAITSWNEYLENTEIEATRLYGDLYLRLTKSEGRLFHDLNPAAVQKSQ
jgi:hypothetical protein